MGVRILGVDTPLGSQAEVPFEPDVELPFKYGPGGFYKPSGVPSITAPATGSPPGTSLSTVPKGAYVNPSTGQPEMLTGPGGIAEKTSGGFNPLSMVMGLNPWARGAIAGAEITRATPAETGEFHPAMITGRPDAPWGTTHGLPAPAAAPSPPARPITPTPATAYPAGLVGPQQVTPPAVGPAAVAQQPNLGNYGASPFTTFDRPNMSPQNSAYGHQGATQMGMLDLSRLFGGGQPAPAATAPASILARPDLAQRVPLSKTPLPVPRPKDKAKPKSSTTSEGGGFNK